MDKPFNCNICEYSCSVRASLTKHVSAVHEKNKPYNWDFCDGKFATKSNI